ncbi:16S rRNA (adenine(1518)-N(6)/adenine(1519)-N(6))-dimethyltransferase RsmA [Fructilactobacillus vespulae]|uniref:16S rRNA (adenine(1518)-N(6)/adenine(1519)-N(6))- dimethyltransferase RsmA n=1 Tax=Fructilactobacillus vespulae TaxID=1249630 RepID=UPI0039B40F22
MTQVPEIGSRTRTLAILNKFNLSAKKSLGQNFLNDLNVLHGIVDAAEITSEDNVIEIGPGIGALTEQLAKRANQVVAFEIDQNLLPVLEDTLYQYQNVTILNQDFLKANLPEVIAAHFNDDRPVKIVANLPYYITKPILLNILRGPVKYENLVFMMQREVADRLCAKPNDHDYGSLSVITQYLNDVEIAIEVSNKAFIPAPKVDSAVVKLSPQTARQVVAFDEKAFFGFVHGCFMHRRKTLWNNLQGLFGKQPEVKEQVELVLEQLNIKKSIRPQGLSVTDFVTMANAFHNQGLLK